MSELKTYSFPVDHGDFTSTVELFYLKSEADKVIAEKDKKIDLYKRGFEEIDKINAYLFAEARHHKYKRCLAMEKWCHAEYDIYNLTPRTEKVEFYRRWRKRWLELSAKFKEAK